MTVTANSFERELAAKTVLLLIFGAALSACAHPIARVVVQSVAKGEVASVSPLDVRFSEVNIQRIPIQDALDRIAAEVRAIYGNDYFFSVAYQSESDPMMSAPLPNPPVTFRGKDVSAGNLFSGLCEQVGWSFKWNAKHNLVFQDGRGLARHLAERRQGDGAPVNARSLLPNKRR